jgi:hypothetical protein
MVIHHFRGIACGFGCHFLGFYDRRKFVIPLILKTLPLFWFVAVLIILRWFHGIASDPRIETIDSSFQPRQENVSGQLPLLSSGGVSNRAAA